MLICNVVSLASLFSYTRRLNLSTAAFTNIPVAVGTRHTGPVELRQRLNLVALDTALLLFFVWLFLED